MLDVDRYRRADLKIGRVHWMRRDGNTGLVRHGGRLVGLPAPAVTLSFELTPYSRLDFRGEEMLWPLRGFDGFLLGPLVGPGFRLLFGRWLSRDTPAEVLRMKRILEDEPCGAGRRLRNFGG